MDQLTTSQLFKAWNEGRSVQPATADLYRSEFASICAALSNHLGHTPLSLTDEPLESRHNETIDLITLKDLTEVNLRLLEDLTARRLSILRQFCRWLHLHKYLDTDPTVNLTATASDDNVASRPLHHSEIRELVAAARNPPSKFHSRWATRDAALITLFAETGLHVTEAVKLRHQDIHFDKHDTTVDISGRHKRTINVTDTVADSLHQYIDERLDYLADLADQRPLFITTKGRPLNNAAIKNLVRSIVQQSSINDQDANTLTLRHTAIANYIARGATINQVQAHFGHDSTATTAKYLHYATATQPTTTTVEQLEAPFHL